MNAFDVRTEVAISPAGVRRLRSGHLWIYSSDVLNEPGTDSPPIVRVTDGARNLLGYAFYSRQSQIRLRLLTREPEPPTREFIRERVRVSIERRRGYSNGNACRLVFGEADLLPSIIVDRYGDYLVLQTLSAGADAIKTELIDSLRELVHPLGILERNDVRARVLEGLPEVRGTLWGEMPERVGIVEGGVRFLVDLSGGQKTGFFLDQSDNRIAARAYAGGRALDCFTNTGGFALHFARQCSQVLAVDISAESLAQARQNADLNGMTNVVFKEANVFDFLREMEHAGEKFDTICLDPPAFAKNRAALAGAKSGYKEINLRALRLLSPEGILVTSSCSYHMSEALFAEILQEAARDARRYVQRVERRGQSRDHPVLAGMPETHYLKCFVLRAI